MITILKEIEKDWFLIQLEETRNYQIWNKWELFEILLERGVTLVDEDFPMTDTEFNERFKKIKEVKEFQKELNK